MSAVKQGFLLLCSHLGNPQRKPLTTAQLRMLFQRVQQHPKPAEDRGLACADLTALGYSQCEAQRILSLLCDEELLNMYLRRAEDCHCYPLCRTDSIYPTALRQRLGQEAPGCLWYRGNVALFDTPLISVVGSRNLRPENQYFARLVGQEAARQGYTLVAGNARGADQTAQNACLEAGGSVICVVADELNVHQADSRILYVSEEDFDAPFSAQRALSRNRIIHALGRRTFVVQSTLNHGGSWDGTVKNLRSGWSPVFCFNDGRESTLALEQMGAGLISAENLGDFEALQTSQQTWF